MAGIVKEFREFVSRGNVIDLAVGVIIGAAFGKIVSSLVADIIMPPIGLLLGNIDFNHLRVTLRGPLAPDKPDTGVYLNWGTFLKNIVDFVLVAAAIFAIVKANNRFKKPPPPPPVVVPREVELLTEIRDALVKK
jgi:large conductance mechanosensitive channel